MHGLECLDFQLMLATCLEVLRTSYVTGYVKRDHFMHNVKSCYEPVKFTCHIGNVSAAVISIAGIFGTKINECELQFDSKNSNFWSAPSGPFSQIQSHNYYSIKKLPFIAGPCSLHS